MSRWTIGAYLRLSHKSEERRAQVEGCASCVMQLADPALIMQHAKLLKVWSHDKEVWPAALKTTDFAPNVQSSSCMLGAGSDSCMAREANTCKV